MVKALSVVVRTKRLKFGDLSNKCRSRLKLTRFNQGMGRELKDGNRNNSFANTRNTIGYLDTSILLKETSKLLRHINHKKWGKK